VKKRIIAAGVGAAAIGIAVAVLPASPALAGPGVVKGITTQTVVATSSAPANDTGEADATCPTGTLLVGGGYVINSAATDWRIFEDAPDGATWLVEPVNFDTQTALSFSAYAICAASAPGGTGIAGYTTHVVQSQVNVPTNDTGEANATCPAGQLRTGGGYDVFNVSPNWSIFSNSPFNNDTWDVQIDNEVPLSTTFDSYAVCLARANAKPVKGLAVNTVDTQATVPPNVVQSADATCGSTQLLTGGGHVIDSVGQEWSIQASAPVNGNDWQVKAVDLDSTSRQFSSMAVCLAKA
jgi:hypothetical protein